MFLICKPQRKKQNLRPMDMSPLKCTGAYSRGIVFFQNTWPQSLGYKYNTLSDSDRLGICCFYGIDVQSFKENMVLEGI